MESTEVVAVPWDVLVAYHFRAKRAAYSVSAVFRMQWLERQDIADRKVWVEQFRATEAKTLGAIISNIMDKRSAHWDPHPTPARS